MHEEGAVSVWLGKTHWRSSNSPFRLSKRIVRIQGAECYSGGNSMSADSAVRIIARGKNQLQLKAQH